MSDFSQPHGEAHQAPLSMGFSQARIIYVHVQSLSCVQVFATPWTVSHQASLSMEFSRVISYSRIIYTYSYSYIYICVCLYVYILLNIIFHYSLRY